MSVSEKECALRPKRSSTGRRSVASTAGASSHHGSAGACAGA
jgi:hypothetical protein